MYRITRGAAFTIATLLALPVLLMGQRQYEMTRIPTIQELDPTIGPEWTGIITYIGQGTDMAGMMNPPTRGNDSPTRCWTYFDGDFKILDTTGYTCALWGANESGDLLLMLQQLYTPNYLPGSTTAVIISPGSVPVRQAVVYHDGEFQVIPLPIPDDPTLLVTGVNSAVMNANGVVAGTAAYRTSPRLENGEYISSVNFAIGWVYENGQVRVLPDVSGLHDTSVIAINNLGDVVAMVKSERTEDLPPNTFPQRATIFRADGSTQDVGTLGGFYSYGSDINDRGQVVGSSLETNDVTLHGRSFFFDGAVLHPIYLANAQGGASADYINNAGEIIGSYSGLIQVQIESGMYPFPGPSTAYYSYQGRTVDLEALVGNLPDGFHIFHGFRLTEDGRVLVFAGPEDESAIAYYMLTPTTPLGSQNELRPGTLQTRGARTRRR